MGARSRNKGRAGEQEVARILRETLNLDIHRNWQGQAAQGGVDLVGVPGWCIEVKRAKAYSRQWWAQALDQATDGKPVLIYRIDGYGRGLPLAEKWQCELLASDCIPKLKSSNCRVVMPLSAWMELLVTATRLS